MLVEGDIVVRLDFYEKLGLRGYYAPNLWPAGVVAYAFDGGVTATQRAAMLDAMAEWEAVAGVTFLPRDTETDYIYILGDTGNWSFVGLQGNRQDIGIYNWNYKFIMTHELGHALGLWHEQSRTNCDTYIQIISGNIQSGHAQNFNIVPSSTEYGPYDYDSVMHYGQCAFSQCDGCPNSTDPSCTNGGVTIVVRPPSDGTWQDNIGQRDHLSVIDRVAMAYLYPKGGYDGTIYVDDSATSGLNDGTSWRNAFLELQSALAVAQAGDDIRVAGGLYKPDYNVATGQHTGDRTASFQLKSGVALLGGYAGLANPGAPDTRDITLYATVLSGDLAGNDGPNFANNGDNSYHVVIASGTSNTAILDGFAVKAGNANAADPHDDGGGIYVSNGSPVIRGCRVLSNSAAQNGGGVYSTGGAAPKLVACSLSDNKAGNAGGAAYNNASIVIENSTLANNTATSSGGGMSGLGTVTIIQSTISNNKAVGGNGGGLRVEGGTWLVRQSTFVNNSASLNGGGIHRDAGTVELYNTLLGFNVAGSTAQDVSGTFSTSSQHNLVRIRDGSVNLDGDAHSITGTQASPVNLHIALRRVGDASRVR
jgi:hypothetical protein